MKKILFLGLSCLSLGSSVVAEPQKTIEPAEVIVVATKGKKTFRQKVSKFVWQASAVCVGVSAATLANILVAVANKWYELRKQNNRLENDFLEQLKKNNPHCFDNGQLKPGFKIQKEFHPRTGRLTDLNIVPSSNNESVLPAE